MLGVLCILGCPVQLTREVFSRLHLWRHTFVSLGGDCLRLASLWRANSCHDSCVLGVYAISLRTAYIFQELAGYKEYHRSLFVESSKAFNGLSKILLGLSPHIFSTVRHCLSKMCATPGACINETGLFSSAAAVLPQSKSTVLCSSAAVLPHKVNLSSCVVARRPSVVPHMHKENLPSCVVARRPLFHKVNLSSCVARWPLCPKVKSTELCSSSATVVPQSKSTEMWSSAVPFHYDLWFFGTGQTNILAPCYLFGKTYKQAYSSATQVTDINILDQITEKVIDLSAHIPLKALMIPLKLDWNRWEV